MSLIRWFGKKYEAPIYDGSQAETPVGQECMHCKERIETKDDGFYDSGNAVFHRACFHRVIIGSVLHQQRKCSCFGGSVEEDSATKGMTVRQEAEAAMAYAEGKSRMTTMIDDLLKRYPEATQVQARFFLSTPNSYIGDRIPYALNDAERRASLFERFLHPADVF